MRRWLSVVILLLLAVSFMPTSMGASPSYTDVSPANGAINVTIVGAYHYVALSINISDSDGDLKYFMIETNATDGVNWTQLSSFEFPNPVAYQLVTTKIFNCTNETKYWWRVSSRDNESNWTNQTYSFITQMNGSQQQGGGGETPSGNISIFPPTPTSGKMFAIIIDQPINTNGYIWIQENMYPVEITNGFGTVQTSEEIYGEAHLWLYKNMQKVFTIQIGLKGSLTLDVPDTVAVDTATDIHVKVGGKQVATANVNFTDPTGKMTTISASSGVMSFVFDKVGTWLVRCELIGQNDVQEVVVTYKEMSVSTNSNQYVVGDDVKINADDGAMVDITEEGVIKIQSIATNGLLMFTPREPGSYRATGTLGNKRGSASFDVVQQVKIKVFDMDTNAQVVTAKAEKRYLVKVVDSRDVPLYDFEQVFTTETNPESSTVPLSGGIGFWTPKQGGTITLHVEEKAGYVTEDLAINVEGVTNYLLIGIIVAVVAIVISLLVVFRSKLPPGLTERFKLKPKREIPI